MTPVCVFRYSVCMDLCVCSLCLVKCQAGMFTLLVPVFQAAVVSAG